MKALLSAYLCLALTFLPVIAYAEDTPPPPPAPPQLPVECQEPVAVTSPCSGVLLPTAAATEGLKCLKYDVPKLRLELSLQEELWQSRETRYKSLLIAEQERGDRFYQLHQEVAVATPPWYESPVFMFFAGALVSGLTVVGITYAVNQPR